MRMSVHVQYYNSAYTRTTFAECTHVAQAARPREDSAASHVERYRSSRHSRARAGSACFVFLPLPKRFLFRECGNVQRVTPCVVPHAQVSAATPDISEQNGSL